MSSLSAFFVGTILIICMRAYVPIHNIRDICGYKKSRNSCCESYGLYNNCSFRLFGVSFYTAVTYLASQCKVGDR